MVIERLWSLLCNVHIIVMTRLCSDGIDDIFPFIGSRCIDEFYCTDNNVF